MMFLLLLAAIGSAPAQNATQSHEAHPSPVQLPMSPRASEAVRRFEDAIATEQAAFRALPATGAIGPNLTIRIALEQAMRRAIDPAVAPLSGIDRSAASAAIWQRIGAIDAANTAYVKAVLPADGWFRSKRDGADVAHNAWLIVQHSPTRRSSASSRCGCGLWSRWGMHAGRITRCYTTGPKCLLGDRSCMAAR
jgi:hypothetical protein